MGEMKRRDFMAGTAAAFATAMAWPHRAYSEEAATPLSAAALREIGTTGAKGSYLGMGTGVRSWNHESALTKKGYNAFMSVLEHAYGNGIRYFDCADMYGSHAYLRDAMRDFMDRSKVMILTKSVSRDAAGVKADIERFRRELDTDTIDLCLFHCLTTADWAEKMQPAMDVMADAKEKGQIRAHGVSCHDLGAMKTAAKHPWTDMMLARVNPFGVKMDGTPDEVVSVLREAKSNGKGVIGMKILGEGSKAGQMNESFKFVTQLDCVDAMTIGFLKTEEIDEVMTNLNAAAKESRAA